MTDNEAHHRLWRFLQKTFQNRDDVEVVVITRTDTYVTVTSNHADNDEESLKDMLREGLRAAKKGEPTPQ